MNIIGIASLNNKGNTKRILNLNISWERGGMWPEFVPRVDLNSFQELA